LELKNTYIFIKKSLSTVGMGMRRGYPNPSGTGIDDFSFPLGMGMVTSKYMKVGNGDGEGKTHPHPAPLPCSQITSIIAPKTKLEVTSMIKELLHRLLNKKLCQL